MVQKKVAGGTVDDSDALLFELAQAVKNNPVTLYSADKCIPCDDGRKMLKGTRHPLQRENRQEQRRYCRATQDAPMKTSCRYLTISKDKQSGFASSNWGSALTAAGYPETSRLPKNYHNAAPVAVAPTTGAAGKTAAATGATTANSGDVAPAAGNAPPGFRFFKRGLTTLPISMTQIDFHTNISDKFLYTCRLVHQSPNSTTPDRHPHQQYRRTGDAGPHAVDVFRNDFLPHVRAGDPLAAQTPVILAADEESEWPHHQMLINLSGKTPQHFARFEKECLKSSRWPRTTRPAAASAIAFTSNAVTR